MTDIAENLKERFWESQYQLLEAWDALGFPTDDDPDENWTAADQRAVDILAACLKSIDRVPSEQIATAKILFERNPVAFDKAATSLTRAIGVTFFPENATSFCAVLNEALS